jgi:hypothetical protein
LRADDHEMQMASLVILVIWDRRFGVPDLGKQHDQAM